MAKCLPAFNASIASLFTHFLLKSCPLPFLELIGQLTPIGWQCYKISE